MRSGARERSVVSRDSSGYQNTRNESHATQNTAVKSAAGVNQRRRIVSGVTVRFGWLR